MPATVHDRTFDARPDRLDFRDLAYRPRLQGLAPVHPADVDVGKLLPRYVKAGLVLDQGTEGACTGFGLACVANYLLWLRHTALGSKARFERVSPRMFYEMAKRHDEWPGTDYEGSSCRGALKGWHQHGVCAEAHWPYKLDAQGAAVFVRPKPQWAKNAAQRPLGVYYRVNRQSVVDMQAAISEIGAVYVSGSVHDGWDALMAKADTPAPKSHEQLPVIGPPSHPDELFGHAFALVGYNERGFVVQNSWGQRWGAAGFAVLPYEDWVAHGTDAWACALGVPVTVATPAGAAKVASSRFNLTQRGRTDNFAPFVSKGVGRQARNPPHDPWPLDRPFANPACEPWSTPKAYLHTLVSGNEGRLLVNDITREKTDTQGYAHEIVADQPLAWWKRQRRAGPLKLLIYAHGGLNSEAESIARIRVLGPCFEANGIYPLFLTWKTGAGETITDLVNDWARRVLPEGAERDAGLLESLGQTKDRAIEAVGHVLGKGVWTEMRENAARAAEDSPLHDRALGVLARELVGLSRALAKQGAGLEVHLAGHSAGSIILGHFLERLTRADLYGDTPSMGSVTLMAPACSVRFAVEKYVRAADLGILYLDRLWLHYLSDDNEKLDGLPSPSCRVYGKSLLYLVSRALDERRKMPLLGMERALVPEYLRDEDQWAKEELEWLRVWWERWGRQAQDAGLALALREKRFRTSREGDLAVATHGGFDNSVEVVEGLIARVLGEPVRVGVEWLGY